DFFTIEEIEIEGKFDISFRLSVKYAIVEFLLAFGTEDGKISIGGPFDFICELLGRDEFKRPVFSSYEELEEILQEGFAIYEDIKAELANM
ncbi:MAG: hypothetical protein NW226_25010, partial [Microscillaceae bacterium]|nr:hypothetical protein [Microscillaceae bacterium]